MKSQNVKTDVHMIYKTTSINVVTDVIRKMCNNRCNSEVDVVMCTSYTC